MNKTFDGATTILGNLVSFFVIGVVVDIASGAAYMLSPADVQGNLDKLQEAGVLKEKLPEPEKNTIHVFMLTEKEWEDVKNSE